MQAEMKRLPSLVVPDEFYELLRLYAFENRMSVSEAVRSLLRDSRALMELAERKGVKLDTSEIRAWGGSRTAQGEE